MSKGQTPAPELSSTAEFLEPFSHPALSFQLALRPAKEPGKMYACVELVYSHVSGARTLVRREGELVSIRHERYFLGAWYRAAVRLHLYYEGKDVDEVVRLHLWNTGMPG